MERRKDSNGRVLQTGESQRKDGLYQYRYTVNGKRKCIYAQSLNELRRKKTAINKQLLLSPKLMDNDITVHELIDKYMQLKQCLRHSTLKSYDTMRKIVAEQRFYNLKIANIKVSDAKQLLIDLSSEYSHGTLSLLRTFMRGVFQVAVDDDMINKNPFSFRLDFIKDDSGKRDALSREQQKSLLEFIRTSERYKRYYHECVVLLGTGLRISEFLGLTIRDINFDEGYIDVNHQLSSESRIDNIIIIPPKTINGTRKIPMTSDVRRSIEALIEESRSYSNNPISNGYGGFIVRNQNGNLRPSNDFARVLRKIKKDYNMCHDDKIEVLTPHIFRHTFCTNIVNAGVNLKSIQYLMGHSDISMSLNVYTHYDFDVIKESMRMIDCDINESDINNEAYTPIFTPFCCNDM